MEAPVSCSFLGRKSQKENQPLWIHESLATQAVEHPRTGLSTSGKKRNIDYNDGDPPDVHKKLPSSAGEDRAMLLGFAMMGFSVLMFFLLGITILKPFMLSTQREESNCTITHTHVMDDWLDRAFTRGVDSRSQGKYPCLQVFVNLAHSGQKALLRYSEEAVQINSKEIFPKRFSVLLEPTVSYTTKEEDEP